MSLTNDSKTNIALKTLLGKAHTDNLKNLGNEIEGASINLPANKIFADEINEDPAIAEGEDIAMKITASLIEDTTSNGHSYFAVFTSDIPSLNITSGDRVKNAISPSFGYKYEAKPYDGAYKIAVGDPKNWIYQYEAGIYYQQNIIGSTPIEIELYIYTGVLLSELGESKADISGDNIESQSFNDNLKTYITASRDIYITLTGQDITGDGTIGSPYATYERALKDLRYSTIKDGAIVTIHLDDSSFEITEKSTKYLSTINCVDTGQLVIEGSSPVEEIVLSSALADFTIPFKYTVAGVGYNATSDFYCGYFVKNITDGLYYPISSSGSNFIYTTSDLDLAPSSIYSLSTTLTSTLGNPFGNLTLGSESIIFKNIAFDFSIDTVLYTGENKGIELDTCKLNKSIVAVDFVILNFTKTYLKSIKLINRGVLYLKNSNIADLQTTSVPYHDILIESTVFYKTTLDESYFIDSNCHLTGPCLFKSAVINENVFTLKDTIKGEVIYTELDNAANLIKYENFQNLTFVFDDVINYKETNKEITANTDVSVNRYILISSYNSQYYLEHIIGYETKAEIYSLSDPIVYCRENNRIYVYNQSASQYTVDNEYVLNTLLGGSTRYLATDFTVVKTNTDRVLIDYLGNTIDTITTDNIDSSVLSTGALNNDKITTQGYVDDLINSSISAVIKLQGGWNATTNDPNILNAPETGFAWRVSVEGATNIGGIIDWKVGDLAIKTDSGWLKIDNEDISAIWGNVSGTITDQTDLIDYISTEISTKADKISSPSLADQLSLLRVDSSGNPEVANIYKVETPSELDDILSLPSVGSEVIVYTSAVYPAELTGTITLENHFTFILGASGARLTNVTFVNGNGNAVISFKGKVETSGFITFNDTVPTYAINFHFDYIKPIAPTTFEQIGSSQFRVRVNSKFKDSVFATSGNVLLTEGVNDFGAANYHDKLNNVLGSGEHHFSEVEHDTLIDGSNADSLHSHEELSAATLAKVKVNDIDVVEATENDVTLNKITEYNSDKSSEYTSRSIPDFGSLSGMFENKGEVPLLRDLGLSQGNINDIGLNWTQSPTPGAISEDNVSSQNAFESFCYLENGIVLASSYNYNYTGDPAGIWKSFDYGKTFNQYVTPSLDADFFTGLLYLGSGIVLVGSASEVNDGDIWRSEDYGDTWTKYEMGPNDGANPDYTSCRAFCDLGNGIVLMGTGGTIEQSDIYKSLDYGLTWNQVTDDSVISAQNILNITYLGKGEVICCAENKVYKSVNYGDTWSLLYTSLDGKIYDLFYIGSNLIFIGTETSIIKSYNKGSTWESFPAPNQVRKIAYVGSGVMFFCASGSGGASVYKSIDDGSTWTEIVAPFTGDRDYALEISYIGNSILLIGVGDPHVEGKVGVYRSVVKEPAKIDLGQTNIVYVDSEKKSSLRTGTMSNPYLHLDDIPEIIVSITGDTSIGSNILSNCSQTLDLSLGDIISGTGIPYMSIIIGISETDITISKDCTAGGTGVFLKSITPLIVKASGYFVLTSNIERANVGEWSFINAKVTWGDLTAFSISTARKQNLIIKGGNWAGIAPASRLYLNTGAQDENFKCDIDVDADSENSNDSSTYAFIKATSNTYIKGNYNIPNGRLAFGKIINFDGYCDCVNGIWYDEFAEGEAAVVKGAISADNFALINHSTGSFTNVKNYAKITGAVDNNSNNNQGVWTNYGSINGGVNIQENYGTINGTINTDNPMCLNGSFQGTLSATQNVVVNCNQTGGIIINITNDAKVSLQRDLLTSVGNTMLITVNKGTLIHEIDIKTEFGSFYIDITDGVFENRANIYAEENSSAEDSIIKITKGKIVNKGRVEVTPGDGTVAPCIKYNGAAGDAVFYNYNGQLYTTHGSSPIKCENSDLRVYWFGGQTNLDALSGESITNDDYATGFVPNFIQTVNLVESNALD
jgi:hypothetical protein